MANTEGFWSNFRWGDGAIAGTVGVAAGAITSWLTSSEEQGFFGRLFSGAISLVVGAGAALIAYAMRPVERIQGLSSGEETLGQALDSALENAKEGVSDTVRGIENLSRDVLRELDGIDGTVGDGINADLEDVQNYIANSIATPERTPSAGPTPN